MLTLLSCQGWHVAILPAVGGGVCVLLAKGDDELRASGSSVAAVVPALLEQARHISRRGVRDVRLDQVDVL